MNSVGYAILTAGSSWRVASEGETAGPYASRGEAFEAVLDLAQGVIETGRPVEVVYLDRAGRPQALRLGASQTVVAAPA